MRLSKTETFSLFVVFMVFVVVAFAIGKNSNTKDCGATLSITETVTTDGGVMKTTKTYCSPISKKEVSLNA